MVITNDGKQNTEKYLNILKIIKKQGYRLICQTSIYIYTSQSHHCGILSTEW